jgi:virginiamycin B lyase
VWVAAKGIPVTKIDPATNTVVAQFVAKGGDAVRVGHGSVWLCSFILEELWRVDPDF